VWQKDRGRNIVTQFTKKSLITVLRQIQNHGWIESVRSPGNDGAVGNTLESILGISENNLPLPNATEWELKAKRRKTVSLTTLFHLEPSPIMYPKNWTGSFVKEAETEEREQTNGRVTTTT
jgi:hypothetical protein